MDIEVNEKVLARRLRNKMRQRDIRLAHKTKHSGETVSEGWHVCSKCLRLKRTSEYSSNREDGEGRRNKICDACLSKIYTLRQSSGFDDQFWRLRSYTVNTAYRAVTAARKAVKVSSLKLIDLDFICKPQMLAELFSKQEGKCFYCSVELTPEMVTVDHAIPKSRGGSQAVDNFRICCQDCNHLKHVKTEGEFLSFITNYVSRFKP